LEGWGGKGDSYNPDTKMGKESKLQKDKLVIHCLPRISLRKSTATVGALHFKDKPELLGINFYPEITRCSAGHCQNRK
jgi:hypothetical protein